MLGVGDPGEAGGDGREHGAGAGRQGSRSMQRIHLEVARAAGFPVARGAQPQGICNFSSLQAHLKFVFSGEAISQALLENGRHSQIATLNQPSAAPLEPALTPLDANAASLGH